MDCGPALSDCFVHALWPVTHETFHSNGVKVSSAQLLSLLVFQFISENIIMLLNIWGKDRVLTEFLFISSPPSPPDLYYMYETIESLNNSA